jgi:hypothetical protein
MELTERRFYVRVDGKTFARLQAQAERERRDVRDEAALVLQRALPAPPDDDDEDED